MADVSVFGTPITRGSRTQRAEAAAKNRNADGKLDHLLQASLHFEKAATGEVHLHDFATGGNFHRSGGPNSTGAGIQCRSFGGPPATQGTRTSCFIYNATGDPITLVTGHDWEGHVAGRSPKIIQNGQWAFLKHVGSPDPNPKGSIGAVVFNIQNYTDSMIAWSNPKKTFWGGKNTAYCQMNDPGYFNNDVDWNEMYHNVRDCGSEYETSMEDFTTKISINAQGSIPRCFAEFYLKSP